MQSENISELKEKVVAINRVAKVVKGGRTCLLYTSDAADD